jgi:hypothetical protein
VPQLATASARIDTGGRSLKEFLGIRRVFPAPVYCARANKSVNGVGKSGVTFGDPNPASASIAASSVAVYVEPPGVVSSILMLNSAGTNDALRSPPHPRKRDASRALSLPSPPTVRRLFNRRQNRRR